MKKVMFLGVVAALLVCTAAFAQQNQVFDLEGDAAAFETIGTTTSSIGFTAAYLNNTGVKNSNGTWGLPKAVLISVETAAIRFTVDGTTPTVTSGTAAGHLMNSGDSYVIRGYRNIEKFRCINAVGSSGAVVKVTYFY